MKRYSVLKWLLLPILLLASGCDEKKNTKAVMEEGQSLKFLAAEIGQLSGKCKVSIDPKLELLGIIQYLADDPMILKKEIDEKRLAYGKDIENHFSQYNDDPAINLYKTMREKGFSYGKVPELTLRINENFTLKQDFPNLETYIERTGSSEDTLKEFLQQLSQFRVKTNFDTFYSKHEEYYKELISGAKSRLDKTDLVGKLIKYYGYEQKSYTVVLYPLSGGGFAERIQGGNGKFDVYDFMAMISSDTAFAELLLHEFGHSYTGPLAYSTFAGELVQYSDLYRPVEEIMKKQYYNNWVNCVDENVVRAATNRILGGLYGESLRKQDLERNKKNGFIYTEAIVQQLEKYEKNRDKYPTFSDFYPEIVKVFEKASQEQVNREK